MISTNNIDALYIHWPFCISKCPYCDFNSHIQSDLDINEFISAYEQELEYFTNELSGSTVKSIYFGGGTPSLAPYQFFDRILKKLDLMCALDKCIEITVEVNPSSAESEKFLTFRGLGINRLSIGVQSFNNEELQFLRRAHDGNDAIKAIEAAATYFEKYSIDLIYTLPGQELDVWLKQLQASLKFAGGHVSAYQLTIEKGTKFYTEYLANKFSMPDDERSTSFYIETSKILKNNGFTRYEVSNYAKKGHESVHNLNYWQYGNYIGIGPGAHSRYNVATSADKIQQKRAIMMKHSPMQWIQAVQSAKHGIQSSSLLGTDEQSIERTLMGLRTIYGVKIANIQNLKAAQMLIEAKLLYICDDRLIATEEGLLLLEAVIQTLTE